MSHSYQDLIVWQRAKQLATAIYVATRTFPKEETYGLVSQLRRAAISVPSNIAEGQGRLTRGEFRQALGTARGSLFELQTQIYIARDLHYLTDEVFRDICKQSDDVRNLLNRLIESLSDKSRSAAQNS